MNVKTLAQNISPIETALAQKSEAKDQVKSEQTSADRDANGQREDQNDEDRSPLSEEEQEKAQEYLEGLEGVKANNLKVRFEVINEVQVFLIEGPDGEIVRRIPDYELRHLLKTQDKKTGQLLNKAG